LILSLRVATSEVLDHLAVNDTRTRRIDADALLEHLQALLLHASRYVIKTQKAALNGRARLGMLLGFGKKVGIGLALAPDPALSADAQAD
jgi:hypothetical protein